MAELDPWETDDGLDPWEVDNTRPAPNSAAPRSTGMGKPIVPASGTFQEDAEDWGRGIASGLAEGTVGFPGIAGDVEGLLYKGINLGSKYLRGGEPPISDEKPFLGTTDEFIEAGRNRIKDATGLDISYEPKGEWARGAKRVSSLVPGAVLTGPGGVTRGVANAAKNALVYGVAPGVGAEAGSAINKATGGMLPDWAVRLGGGLAGAGIASAASNAASAVKNAYRGSASEALKAKSADLFKRVRDSGEKLDPNDMANALDMTNRTFATAIKEGGFTANNAPETFKVIADRLSPDTGLLKNTDLVDVFETRQQLANIVRDARGTTEGLAAQKVLKSFDDELDAMSSIKGATANQKQARFLWSAAKRTEAVEDMIESAAAYKGGAASGLGDKARTILKDKTLRRQFSPKQRELLKDLSKGREPAGFDPADIGGGIGAFIENQLLGGPGFAGYGLGRAAGRYAGKKLGGRRKLSEDQIARNTGNKIVDYESARALGRREPVSQGGAATQNARKVYNTQNAVIPPSDRDIVERWGNTYAKNPKTGQYEIIQEGAR